MEALVEQRGRQRGEEGLRQQAGPARGGGCLG